MSNTPKPIHLRSVPKPDDGDDRETLVDVTESDIGMLLSLPTLTFPRGALVLDTEILDGYYIILSGKATEYAISLEGEANADPVELSSKDVIGLVNNVRVEAITDLKIANADNVTLANATPTLRSKVMSFVLDAARKRNTSTRDRYVALECDLSGQKSTIEGLESQIEGIRLESSTMLNAKRAELEDKLIDNARLAKRIQTLTRELKDKAKECASAITIIQLYKDEQEETEETLHQRTEALNKLREALASLSGFSPFYLKMMASSNPELAKLGHRGITLLFDLGKQH